MWKRLQRDIEIEYTHGSEEALHVKTSMWEQKIRKNHEIFGFLDFPKNQRKTDFVTSETYLIGFAPEFNVDCPFETNIF